ncbi:uncharacterized protein SPAPADRAFT_66248 [Spathaspora passalidarum NRRL Y-27907]|uniref:Ubiquitin carboxyl-terminal hydrolase n=1 Tax=Spathaspora passalidarum (strain NRRL Y-27907 / 11-Y1) TaxID=619300 RepID=G3ALM3_SPAPN|nr:uncharacterized protein SPAPADRAFT_66248 [Spathaspora passalidarum NRRL Y-27907]EGW33266.1 hypothetical protein SPAPADRAFT_66248 [Spathaspora passalidarum NRRL Y-27907]
MTIQLPSDIPSTIPSGSKIYKDDCMYSFDTAENNDLGLDIDLKTYRAYSRTPSHNYTKENFLRTGNYLYLNIKKTLKPQEQRDRLLYDHNGRSSPKIQKLEVKDVSDEDYYNTTISVYDIKEDKLHPRESLSPEFNRLIDEILTANSSNRQDEIKQWEQEILPCEHSIDVQQFEIGDQLDLTKCGECELGENLWICLHCGVLGCGRQQYGSALKGNGHALAHFELSQHPVAIKLGSLSAEADSCDVYCYQCNDEVKVPNLADKLVKFGIDLNKVTKTEKSLVELNIDQNLNYDFRLEGKDGTKLVPVYGSGLTGFQNLGNSCYINSVLQALFTLPSYQNFFKSLKFPDNVNPADDLQSQLIKIYDGLLSGRYSKPGSLKGDDYQLGIKPSAFKTLIGDKHVEFSTQKQQDAFEFLLYFFDKVDSEFGLKLNQDLKFLLANKLICMNCSHGTLTEELVDNISVPVEDTVESVKEDGTKIYKPVTLEDCFRSYTEDEAIEGYECDHCHSKSVAVKACGFQTYPKHLVVNVKRIQLENWVPVKVEVPIKIPYELNLEDFPAPEFGEGETEIVIEQNKSSTFTPDQEAMSTLLGMGFPESRCVKGLYHTGNKNAEDAMNWIFGHMDDADIDAPFVEPETSKSSEPSEDSIVMLTSMGFTHQLARKALILNNGDANAAAEWLFTNPDDDGVIEETNKPAVNIEDEKNELLSRLKQGPRGSPRYKLQSAICHKGGSVHSGHYVVFIRKEVLGKEEWVLFNDEKVVICDEESLNDIKDKAYIYVFEQV